MHTSNYEKVIWKWLATLENKTDTGHTVEAINQNQKQGELISLSIRRKLDPVDNAQNLKKTR